LIVSINQNSIEYTYTTSYNSHTVYIHKIHFRFSVSLSSTHTQPQLFFFFPCLLTFYTHTQNISHNAKPSYGNKQSSREKSAVDTPNQISIEYTYTTSYNSHTVYIHKIHFRFSTHSTHTQPQLIFFFPCLLTFYTHTHKIYLTMPNHHMGANNPLVSSTREKSAVDTLNQLNQSIEYTYTTSYNSHTVYIHKIHFRFSTHSTHTQPQLIFFFPCLLPFYTHTHKIYLTMPNHHLGTNNPLVSSTREKSAVDSLNQQSRLNRMYIL
jgi:hypothetical protein